MKTPQRLVSYYDDGSTEELYYHSPFQGIYAYALHDFECNEFYRADWGYRVPRMLLQDKDKLKNDDGFPEMVPLRPREGVKLTERLQWWWVAQLVWSRYRVDVFEYELHGRTITVKEQFHSKLDRLQQAYIEEAWRQLTRDDTAFTNHSGTNDKGDPTGIDYIRGTNGGQGTPVLWENGCGGSTYRVNYQTVTDAMEWIELKALKTSDYGTWKRWKYDDPRYRCYFTLATNSTPFLVGTRSTLTNTGPWKVDPMHMLGGRDVPVPLISDTGTVSIHRTRVRILRDMHAYPRNYNP